MRTLFSLLAGLCLSLPAFASGAYTTVTAVQIVDASGATLRNGTAYFTPVDTTGAPISVRVGGGGQMLTRAAQAQVVNGILSVTLADVTQTSPSNVCYHVQVYDNSNRKVPVLDIPCIQPNGTNYSLDNYSTSSSPILPITSATYNGNLGILGNLSVTGNLALGGLNVASIVATSVNATSETAGTLVAQSTNGVLNATQYAGADIGAKVNAAYAACTTPACEVYIPAGTYTYSTGIVMPNTAMTTLEMAPGAQLTYTGSGWAIITSAGPGWGPGSYQGDYTIRGGHLIGTTSAKAGIVLTYGTNHVIVSGVAVDNFPSGDALLDVGSNGVTIEKNKFQASLIGVHLMASPGYASNNVHVVRNVMVGNQWGVVNGDVSQWSSPWVFSGQTGVSSPNYNNTFDANDFEANTVGAVIDGLTVGSQYLHNYLESNPRNFVDGMSGDAPMSNAQYTALYGIPGPNGGNSRAASFVGNYWTTGLAHSLVEVRAAFEPVISWNTTDGSGSACLVDLYIGTNPQVGPNEDDKVTAVLCQGGTAGWNQTNIIPAPLQVKGALSSTGPLSGGPLTSTGVFALNNGATITPGGGGAAVGTLGPITIYTTTTVPSGGCTAGSIDIGTFGFAVCQSGTWTVK